MSYFDDLREKNKKTLNDKEKLYRNTTQKSTKTIPQNTQKKQIPVNTTRGRKNNKSQNKHKLDEGAKKIQEKAIKENAFPQAMVRFNERVLNDGVLAPVSIPYQIATGKRLLDFGFDADSDSARKGAAVGNFAGTAAAYGLGYGAAGKMIGKGAGKLLATDTGKKATAKIIASKAGQKAGKEAAEKVAEGIARNIVGDATVGTLMNLSDARGRGLEGKELATDMAINAAFDAVLGTGFEFAPMAWRAGKNAIKNTKVEPRLVDGKVKNVRVRQIPQNTYKVSHSGNVNERLGAKTVNETLGATTQKTAQDIPHAKRAFAPETQKKVFDAVEKRSGARITFADLPEGVDGTYQNGVITISNKASNPAYTVLKHELTHHIETSGHYAELSEFIQNSMRDAGYNVDQSINDIISDYARMGKNLTNEEAQKEFTAKFAEEYLFNSEKSIERLARENPNVFRQIYDWIVDTIHKIGASEETKFLIDAQRKYEKALRTAGNNPNTGDISYSLKTFEDGKRFVDVDTDTSAFDGLSLREQGKLAVKIIKEKYAGKAVGIDNPIFVNGAGAGEFGFPLNKLGNTEHSAKMKSATELDNIFDAGHNFRNVPDGADGHVHEDVTGGFDYHDVIFKVGDRYYEGRINVKNTDRGKLFKDITKIKDVTEDISSSYGSNPKSTFLRTSSMNSIGPRTQNVKKKTETAIEIHDSLGRKLSEEQGKYFEGVDPKLKDEEGNVKVFYHGTGRADRVGREFKADRATSGPMAFFTDDRQIATNYSKDKADTSLSYDSDYDDYYTQFRTSIKGKDSPVGKLWSSMPLDKRIEATEKARHITWDEDLEKIIFDPSQNYGNGSFDDYLLKEHKGNVIDALTESWLENGELLGRESDFLDILKKAGIDADVKYMDPNYREEAVYEVYLNIRNAFDTSEVTQDFINKLRRYAETADMSKYNKSSNYADMWDKNNIDVEEFARRLSDDMKEGTSRAWTSIPDVVTDFLKREGYDGIVDSGGKLGGASHQVAIPFYPEQIKDINNAHPTKNSNIDLSTGRSLQKDELLNRLQKTSENLYGEAGNKYLRDIPPQAKKGPQPIPYADRKKQFVNKKIGLDAVPSVGLQLPGANHSSDPVNIIAHKLGTVKEKPQPIPHADTIPKARSVASESPDVTSSERWDYMLENAPGERHTRKLTDEEWSSAKTYADDRFRADSGISKREAEVLYAEPRTEVKETKKGQQYERRKIREADKEVREALGANKYSDGPYIKKRMDETVEKMKTGSLSKAEKDELFDEMFANGIKIDTEFATHYQDLKKTLRETPIKVSEGIRKNITDFKDFRRNNMNKIRLNDHEGVQADIFYDELRSEYPELFPELNTPEEMVEKIAEVADGIKTAEKRVSEDIFSEEIYTEAKKRFEEVMDNLEKEVSIVKRHSEKHSSDITIDQMEELIGSLGKFKRQAEKVKSKVILNDEDRILKEQLLQGRLAPEALRKNNLNANNILKVYEAEKPAYELEKALKKLGNKTKESYRETARSLLEDSGSWKDKRGLNYARETPERNFVDIAGKETGEKINKEIVTPIHEHEAAAMRMKNELREEVRKLKISNKAYDLSDIDIDAPGLVKKDEVPEAALVQLYGEKLIRKEDLEFIGADVTKIENAVNAMRGIYNQLIEKANNELIRHGYEPIEFRKDYFPHFMEDKPDGILAQIGRKLGFDVNKDELPTDIAGLTHTFRPGKKWFGNALQRKGPATEYNAVKGFDLYIEGISDVIYHTEDIQKLRALESELRFMHSDNGIKERVKAIKDSDMPDTVKESLIEKIYAEGNIRLGGLATWLRNYTDQLAGKKSQFDRVFEQVLGRGIYNTTKALESRVAANMVALNPASWLTNYIPLVQAGELSPKYILEGMSQAMGNKFRKTDNIADISTFLTNRRGSDTLWRSKSEKVQEFLTRPMQMIDNFTSEALVRAKYAEQINKGAHPEDAIRTADRFAADIIADRSKGALPTVFNSKNPVSKILTMYQVEVNNQWSHLMKDIPRSKENVAQVAMAFTNFAIGAYIFNDVYERFVGRRPALDPISWVNDFVGDATGKKVPNFTTALEQAMKGEGISLEEVKPKSGGGVIASLGENVSQDIPFVGGLFGGGRVPISSALPNIVTVATNIGNLITGDVSTKKGLAAIGKELAKPATYILPPVGGGQAKKAVESTMAFAKGGSYGMDNEGNEKLRFAVDKDPWSVAKGIAFGQYSIGNSGDYVESGFKMLSVDKTKAYKALTAAGVKNTEAEKFIRSLPDSKTEMRKAIMNSKFTPAQKNAVGRVLDDHSPDYTSQNSFTYSQMSDKEKKAVNNLTKYGMTQKKAEKAYNVQKEYSSQTEKANALLEAGYHDGVLKALGLGEKGITGGKALHSAGLDNTAYQYTRKNADKNDDGSISIEEAKKYLDKTSYSRKQKYALVKALTGCKDSNNPYR